MQLNPEAIRRTIEELSALGGLAPPGPPPLYPPDRGGNSGGMEPRVAKLEAQMESVQAELSKLASVPADVAVIKERLSHLPTKAEMSSALDAAVDRLAARTQRIVGVGAAGVGAIIAIITLAIKIIAP